MDAPEIAAEQPQLLHLDEAALKTKARELANNFLHEPLIAKTLERNKALLKESAFPYHNYTHVADVLEEALLFALADRALQVPNVLSDTELRMLCVASVYHEIEYWAGRLGHEMRAAKLALDELTQEFTAEQRTVIADAIEDTKLSYTDHLFQPPPRNMISPYLQDADLSNFGRADFAEKMRLVYREDKATTSPDLEQSVFLNRTYQFITHHTWRTKSAELLRKKVQEENVEWLKNHLQEPTILHDYL